MRKNSEDIYNNNTDLNNGSWNEQEGDQYLNPADALLFETMGEFMKGRMEMEEVMNDPDYQKISLETRAMVSGYQKNSAEDSEQKKFIINAQEENDEEMNDEIREIKQEIKNSNVKNETAEWVREFREKKQVNYETDPKENEIRSFIKNSIESKTRELEFNRNNQKKNKLTRKFLIRYASLSAAAVIAGFFIVKALLPASDPGQLFELYYEPFPVVSSLTRDANAHVEDEFALSVEQYKLGNYQVAVAGFSKLLQKDAVTTRPAFFMGISYLALGNYEQSVIFLSDVAGHPGEYHKDATWYLGLAYLKTGKTEKARECFEFLAQSAGFYSGRSGKILLRLK